MCCSVCRRLTLCLPVELEELELLEVPEVMRCVLLRMLEVLEVLELMRCVLLCMLEFPKFAGGAGGDAWYYARGGGVGGI